MKPVYSSRLLVIPTSVGWVSQFYDTRWVQFSQSNLQKGLVLFKRKFKIFFTREQGYNIYKKNLNWFSQCWFSKIWEKLIIFCRFSQTRYYLIFLTQFLCLVMSSEWGSSRSKYPLAPPTPKALSWGGLVWWVLPLLGRTYCTILPHLLQGVKAQEQGI
jgi:hypothetical protein